ncbi:uncharacterized protein BT62DRAFT_898118 [Guyanagaster necrorhizus]|uniref:Cytochrome c oxidase assembly protein n=1 Tax=Guyanagaster necrorhizus TaxID=856835 RepID=A0A9P8ASN3_9AGAR|nr:uncharacterized protein BT62DRAFT_898118 [Guyanagaster necrorhizus MCA 3950]KAG7445042.1 hypothetical protein BT62DRAFT_898118 [Guyanagaster necrorhizus MCA 3950]
MSLRAKATLTGACLFTALTVYAVHFQQKQERETQYQGVLKDDVRRTEKMRQRQEDFEESKRKRALYESVEKVDKTTSGA